MNKYYKHTSERKALPVKAVVVSAMNTFLLPSKKNNTGSTYEEIANKWLNILPIKVLDKSNFKRYNGGTNECELQIPVTDIRDMFTYTYTKDGRRHKWFDWFHENYPLWMTTSRGYVGRYSYGIPTFNLIDTLTKIPAENFIEVWQLDYESNITPGMETEIIEIDAINLGHYIEYCKTLNNNSEKFQRATARAIMIHKLALGLNETKICPLSGKTTYLIPQTYTTAHSGRRYYTGSSALQTCSKSVRSAALGPCYEVDLSSSVYSFYKWLGTEFDLDTNILTQLLENKMGFRRELAQCFEDTNATPEFKLELVKDVMQAIGFGSNPDSGYSTVSKVIYNKEDYERLTTHPKFVALRKVYKDLLKCVKADAQYVQLQKEYKKATNNGKWTSFMAYLYQSYETIVMSEVKQALADRQVLLWVHDGVYVKHKPNLMDVQYVVDKLNRYATVDLEKHEKYTRSSGKAELIVDQEAQHRARIAEQERIAKAKYSAPTPMENLASADPIEAMKMLLEEEGYQ